MTTTNWDQLYNDLSPRIAKALRNARVKPEKLTTMPDGEILSLEGIGDKALETIRVSYPPSSVEKTTKEDKKDTKTAKKTKVKAKVKKEIKKTKAKPKKTRSLRYQKMKRLVKKDKTYPLSEAIDLLIKMNHSLKVKTVGLHLNTIETGLRGEIQLPHSSGKSKKIEIFSEKTVVKINADKLDFDILLATPADMPQLAKHAKVLGPKGLMPNPKASTITDNPEKRAQELSSGNTLTYKTEGKFPLIHLSLGSLTQDSNHLKENIKKIIKTITPAKIISAYLITTQTPSVKLDLSFAK